MTTTDDIIQQIKTYDDFTQCPDLLGKLFARMRYSIDIALKPYLAKTPYLAEDLRQESFIAMVEALPTYSADKGSFSTWLRYFVQRRARAYLNENESNGMAIPRGMAQRIYELRKYEAMYLSSHGVLPDADTACDYLGITKRTYNKLKSLSQESLRLDDVVFTDADGAETTRGELIADDSINFVEDMEQREQQNNVRQALTTLPETERLVIECRYYDGMNYAETERKLGLRKGTARKLESKALYKLSHAESIRALEDKRDRILNKSYYCSLNSFRRSGDKVSKIAIELAELN